MPADGADHVDEANEAQEDAEEMGFINALGMFWRRSEVNWTPRVPVLMGFNRLAAKRLTSAPRSAQALKATRALATGSGMSATIRYSASALSSIAWAWRTRWSSTRRPRVAPGATVLGPGNFPPFVVYRDDRPPQWWPRE